MKAFRLLPLAALGLGLVPLSVQSKAVLEEVIVTAQHRAQSLQDVPVSVSAIGGDKMIEAGINRMEDLQAYVPNLTVTESGISTDIFIRGIGTGMNQGFEQSVGMYVDGIYYGRAQLARAPFLDLSRAEVLRGPQNILHGKNSIAGAVNLHTANPGQEFEGFVSALYEPEFDERVFDLVLSGPITDKFGARFAARLRDYGGYVENLTLDRFGPQHDQATFRLKLHWEVDDDTTASLKLESGKFDSLGRHGEVIRDDPSTSSTFLFAGRTEAEILDRTFFPPFVDVDTDESVRNNYQDYKGSSNGNFSNNDTANITLDVTWLSDAGNEFKSITGLMAYEYDDLCDCDSTAAPLFKLALAEEYWQFSQELRWMSPVGEPIDYIGGVYLQRTDLRFNDKLIQDSPVVVGLINAADFQDGGTRGDYDPNPLGIAPEEVAGIGDAGNAVANITAPREFTSVSDIASAFMQATFNLSETFRLTLGGRYTYEHKTGSRSLDLADLNGNSLPIGEVDTVAAISFAAERHDLKGERSETHFSPLVNVQWDYSLEGMAYFTATRGFKAGGFDARSNQSPSAELTPANPNAAVPNRTSLVGTFEYDEEIATSFELGLKTGLLDGAAELNIAAFYTIYEDLQISIFDGTLGFNVGNAKEAITQGIELDARYQVTEYLSLGGALALLDFEFTDFENGQCRQGQTPTSDNGLYCDYTGQSNQYVADWSGTFIIGYLRPISDTLGLGLTLDVVFTDDYNPSSNVDPRVGQEGFTKFNGRIGFGAIDQTWEVSLVGKNLTDEAVIVYAADTPLANTIFGATTFTGFVEAPRSVALQMTYRW
ncbi:outer membrane receptor protein involved in Fe transport [Litorivivens lipolytica]|uniref:Outer membrane receptor protein involved in Fe transport n=1 Tax=Litorivivens lipolytica TaxID=1524264 RepID=A0A7W4W204_9GAMM|nr:TonB-dependent receptor [Litorivivens lipolytica]MBB3045983.1 outer membrane receptor protein involved in Fe transport [Litorivivens lipolytica]